MTAPVYLMERVTRIYGTVAGIRMNSPAGPAADVVETERPDNPLT